MVRVYCADGSGHAAAWALLQYAWRDLCGGPLPETARTPEGKPWFPGRPELHFSLSHADGAVLAMLGDVPCGCDAERVRAVKPGLPARVCSPLELTEFDFFELWVLKESYIKLAGRMPAPLPQLCFTRAGAAISGPEPDVRFRLYELPGYRAAAACRGGPLPERLIRVPASALESRA